MILTRKLPGLLYTHRYTVYSILIFLAIFTYFLFKWNIVCTNIQALQHASKMCKLYREGKADGSLCLPMCVTKDIQSLTCHTFGSTKEAVFSAEWQNTRLVFKTASSDVPSLHWFDNGKIKYPSEKDFLNIIRSVVRKKLNFSLAHDCAMRLTKLRASYEEKDPVRRRQEMDNIWLLMHANEYLLSTIYNERDVFPQMLGTCGPYFAVEYLEPIREATSLFSINEGREEWGRRLRTSLQILDLLEEFESSFLEPFHLCDIKLDHFGLVKGGNKLKFVDLDGVYPKSIINNILSNNVDYCDKDDDCDFYDCRSKCLKDINKCSQFVTNNNLQIVCEKIFLGWKLSNTVIVPGLLVSQHTPTELASILRQCANPEGEEGKPRSATDEEIKRRLINVLSEIEQSVSNDFIF